MTVLRNIEQKIEALFEGVFGRAFRTNVQPVELARKLAKEMDDHRMVSVSRVYAPNEYAVYLSPGDREQFASYEESLLSELQDYLGEHARRESYVLLSSPQVLMNTDSDLDVGEFGIATRMVQPEPGQGPSEPVPAATPGATMVYKPQGPPTQAATPGELGVGPRGRHPRRERDQAHGRQGQLPDRPLEGLRHPACRPKRLQAPRRTATGGHRVLDPRPRLDERADRQRAPPAAGEARERRPDHSRLDRACLSQIMIAASVDVEGVLLLLKACFLVLLYFFIWRIVRTASRDLRLPQESFVLGPREAAAAGLRPEPELNMGRLVVLKSTAIDENTEFVLDSAGISIGRGGPNEVRLDGDDFASAQHARVEPRRDGVWIEDVGSTNGTFVNGIRLSKARKLAIGDLVRVGETDLRFEE